MKQLEGLQLDLEGRYTPLRRARARARFEITVSGRGKTMELALALRSPDDVPRRCYLRRRCVKASKDSVPPRPLLSQCCTGCAACLLGALAVFVLVVIIGVSVEAAMVAAAPSPLPLGNETCGRYANGSFDTFPSRAVLRAAGNATLAHCAACGACSTDADLDVLRATAATLTKTVTACALKVFVGRDEVRACLAREVGFTAECTACWVDNVVCDQRNCVFTCLYSLLRGEKNNRDAAPEELSSCLRCDEKLCGPAFMGCAGANRRRSSITSDIGRSAAEMCNLTAL